MAQRYDQFGQDNEQDASQNPHATYNTIPGLFPAALPFQPNFQQSWQDGQYGYNTGFTPGNVSNGFFLEQQADYIALENGEEFFDNQGDHVIEAAPFAPSSRVAHDNTLSQNASTPQKPPPSSETTEMLNTLRAKLMKQKAAADKAKTPEANAKAPSVNGNGTVSGDLKKSLSSSVQQKLEDHVNSPATNQASPALAAAITTAQTEGNPSQTLPATSQPPVSSMDIEALFSSVRAAEAAKKSTQTSTKVPPVEVARIKSGKEKLATYNDANNNASLLPLRAEKNGKVQTQNSTSSSEQLEQGEIAEEPSKSTSSSTKPPTPKAIDKKVQGEKLLLTNKAAAGKMPGGTSSGKSKATQPANPQLKPLGIETSKFDTAVAGEAHRQSHGNPQKSTIPTSTKSSGFKPSDAGDRREERPTLHERRRDSCDDRRGDRWLDSREPYHANRRHSHDRPAPYDRENGRDRPRGEPYRPASRPNTGDAGILQSHADPAQDERRGSKAGRALEIRSAIPDPEAFTTEQAQPTEDPSEDAADVQDWLDMTGFFDKAYREKALARHRKLIELDRQRAELEMESKVELEERLHLSRFSSLMPRASTEARGFTPQILAKAMMPPPSIPTKDVHNNVDHAPKEDAGIQIKDLARRNTVTSTTRMEDSRPIPSPTLTPGVKRPRSGDLTISTHKPVEKQARTDPRSNSSNHMKSQPSPTVAAKPPARREYPPRSRSPEPPRRRSPSPPYYRKAPAASGDSRMVRRLSDDDGYSPLRRPNLSRNTSPHTRQGPHYDDFYDHGSNYQRYHPDYDARPNHGADSYANERRGGYISNRGRGGRPRGRAGNLAYRASYSRTLDRGGSE